MSDACRIAKECIWVEFCISFGFFASFFFLGSLFQIVETDSDIVRLVLDMMKKQKSHNRKV